MTNTLERHKDTSEESNLREFLFFLFPTPATFRHQPLMSLKLWGSSTHSFHSKAETAGPAVPPPGLQDGWEALFARATICSWPLPSSSSSSSSPGRVGAEGTGCTYFSTALEGLAWCGFCPQTADSWRIFCMHTTGSSRNTSHSGKQENISFLS